MQTIAFFEVKQLSARKQQHESEAVKIGYKKYIYIDLQNIQTEYLQNGEKTELQSRSTSF